jgi:tripartite-type tricarboxylate transporter receptor subunit TctC
MLHTCSSRIERGATRLAATAALALIAGLGLGGTVQAADYPAKPVTIVVQTGPGGSSDLMARKFAQIIADHKLSPQPVNVLNKAGGSGEIAISYLLKNKDDPYNIFAMPGAGILSSVARDRIAFDDMKQICILGFDQNVVVVSAKSKYNTIGDLIQAAKDKPDSVILAGAARGGGGDLAGRLIQQTAGVQFNFISFKSGIEAVQDVLSGNADFAIQSIPETAQLLRGGLIRPIGILADERIGALPDVPTLKEQGVDVAFEIARGFSLMSGASQEALDFWGGACKAVYDSKEYKDYAADAGFVAKYLDSAASEASYRAQYEELKPILEALASGK